MHALLGAALAALIIVAAHPLQAAAPSADEPVLLDWEVVSRRPHDTDAFTQGLELDEAGRLYESTGRLGRSSLRELDAVTGALQRSVPLPDDRFGEGLTVIGDELLQLTLGSGVATRYEADTFAEVETYDYLGEGWGLCYDGGRLVMSDGSDQLRFRDPNTFEIIGSVSVTRDGAPLEHLNELECVEDVVWANVWKADEIVRIDPGDGRVTGVIDLGRVLDPYPTSVDPTAVLNGIAYDPEADTYLVTGKLWPELIEIRILDATTGD